jgi:RNA polymerase sigma-70 factor (ECF subfamily)
MSLADVVVHPAGPDVWPQVKVTLDGEVIRKAMESLPREQAEAITMAYFGGYTSQEIAERLAVPLGTVKGRIRLGMQKLRAMLRNYGEGGTD